MSDVSYWLPPNTFFRTMMGCQPTGRLEVFHQMPHAEWSCPNRYPQLPIDEEHNRYAWWSGRGLGEGPQQFFFTSPSNPILQEQLRTPEGQKLLRDTAAVRTMQQSAIFELPQEQQAEVRSLLERGVFRTVEEALDHVRRQFGMPPLDYSDVAVQQWVSTIEQQQQQASSRSTWSWVIIGGAALVFAGVAAYYVWWK